MAALQDHADRLQGSKPLLKQKRAWINSNIDQENDFKAFATSVGSVTCQNTYFNLAFPLNTLFISAYLGLQTGGV